SRRHRLHDVVPLLTAEMMPGDHIRRMAMGADLNGEIAARPGRQLRSCGRCWRGRCRALCRSDSIGYAEKANSTKAAAAGGEQSAASENSAEARREEKFH